ncbi:MAG: TonB-dependent receptor plug domain-containing protein [Flavobacteriales bacterium]
MTRTLRFLNLLGSALVVGAASAQVDTTLYAPVDTSRNANARAPIYSIDAQELDESLGAQDISGVLQSSRDVFTSTAGFNFGNARFRIRGYDGENTLVTINGVLINDLEYGFAPWTLWGGLNDVTRWMRTHSGVAASRETFGSIGGHTEIGMRASELRKGLRASVAFSDRSYRQRVMVTYNTGMQANGWAFSVSGSRRWAKEGYVEGTSYDAWAYFLGVEKKINDRQSLGFTYFGAPIVQGRQASATQEAYDLTGSNYYNPNWGFQDGEKRNAKISFDHKPVFLLTHNMSMANDAKLQTTVLYTFGRDGLTSLNWFDARDPRPDYYRYLPSYYDATDASEAARLTGEWANNSDVSQINWDQLYFANGKNLYSVVDAEGIAGNTITGNRSKYIVEEQRTDPTRWGINTVWNKPMKANGHLTAGASWNRQVSHNYKLINDLLGGDFWLDLDQFALRDLDDPSAANNDLNTPNHVVRDGDRFGYDYEMHVNNINAFGQYEHTWRKLEAYLGASVANTTFFREGNVINGRFPSTSEGVGEKHSFLHGGVKAGAVYKLTGRHYITANAAYMSRPPIARSAYYSARTHDGAIQDLTNEKVSSMDVSYLIRAPRIKGRLTAYYAKFADQIWSRSFYHDEYLTLINYTMTGVDQTHKGIEFGAEANITSTWVLTAVYATGQYLYSSRPTATITRDNSSEVLASDRTVYWKNYRVGGMPQTAASIGIKYNAPKFWFVGVNGNYFDDIYLDPNPDRRTAEATSIFVTDDPQVDLLLEQEKLESAFMLDIFGGKSWMFSRKYRLALNASISNLFDVTDFITGGFEQLRYDRQDVDRFPSKYSYMYGRTFFAMATFSF